LLLRSSSFSISKTIDNSPRGITVTEAIVLWQAIAVVPTDQDVILLYALRHGSTSAETTEQPTR
jgi:hypothetical protein